MQVRRVVSLKVTGISRVVLAQLESPLDLTEHVTKLCLASYDPSFSSCWVSGTSGSSYTKTVSTSVSRCEDKLCLGPGDVEEGDSGGIFSFAKSSFETEQVLFHRDSDLVRSVDLLVQPRRLHRGGGLLHPQPGLASH